MTIGIFGAGHMGSAMIKGWLRSEAILPQELLVRGGRRGTAQALQKELNFKLTDDNHAFLEQDIIFLAVNTPLILPILNDLKEILQDKIIPIVSVSAGVSVKEMQAVMGDHYPLAQAIPNTPVQINQGMTGIVYSENITLKNKELIQRNFNYLGELVEITEDKIGIFGTLAGCGPAFVDVFMEALSDGAVLNGMDREMAYHVAANMVASSANLLLETGKHPGELKDGVTSPGGTTIKGITALEKEGFRYATINAIDTIMKS
ncbi:MULTISPECIES: pyrroline-5-carboxylate reductase [Vagococcus]|uniref:Pyrroline-5-carboxylate reductase n=1 Tax=Vagococcus fluvialis bH819 TaxID=1255619 RepID=A0A1X6WR09_9ENTE|nr:MULTISPECIES: pyrroline-5-carboxylate reductase [Vagococcus]SLM86672.1 Pyrroline-5-carboxylate reductase [Vagococcus fluvialis bH819]HCM90880.1 pyrroline-5-carboxylate reductase [Vagococcus sp.]